MKVSLRRSGGFAGIALSAAVDTATLPPAEAKKVEQLAAPFAAHPASPAPDTKARDAYTYELEVDGHRYDAGDTNLPDAWRPLVEWLVARK